MSPDQVQTLTAKVDKVFGAVSKVETSIALLSQQLTDHTEREADIDKLRKLTCPQEERIGKMQVTIDGLGTNINAVAGIMRDHIEAGNKAREAAAESRKFWTRHTAGEAVKMAGAVTVALLLAKVFGL